MRSLRAYRFERVKTSITIVDYGRGNLFSVRRAMERCGVDVVINSDPDVVRRSEKIILPGVGAFADGMQQLRSSGLDEAVCFVAKTGGFVLGLCLGMQLLLESSEEFGLHNGLGLIAGQVIAIPKIQDGGAGLKIPHIGWNALRRPEAARWDASMLRKTRDGEFFYFVHSFMARPASNNDLLATCRYGDMDIPAVIGHDNIWGTQFHPEKSGISGLRVLSEFANVT